MTVFEDVFGHCGSMTKMKLVNGMTNVHEKDNKLTFSITPTHKADTVVVEKGEQPGLYNITLYKRKTPYQYFQHVDVKNVVDVLEIATDVLF